MASGRYGRPHNEPEGPKEVIGMLREMAAAMREQAAAAHCMMDRRSKGMRRIWKDTMEELR